MALVLKALLLQRQMNADSAVELPFLEIGNGFKLVIEFPFTRLYRFPIKHQLTNVKLLINSKRQSYKCGLNKRFWQLKHWYLFGYCYFEFM